MEPTVLTKYNLPGWHRPLSLYARMLWQRGQRILPYCNGLAGSDLSVSNHIILDPDWTKVLTIKTDYLHLAEPSPVGTVNGIQNHLLESYRSLPGPSDPGSYW